MPGRIMDTQLEDNTPMPSPSSLGNHPGDDPQGRSRCLRSLSPRTPWTRVDLMAAQAENVPLPRAVSPLTVVS